MNKILVVLALVCATSARAVNWVEQYVGPTTSVTLNGSTVTVRLYVDTDFVHPTDFKFYFAYTATPMSPSPAGITGGILRAYYASNVILWQYYVGAYEQSYTPQLQSPASGSSSLVITSATESQYPKDTILRVYATSTKAGDPPITQIWQYQHTNPPSPITAKKSLPWTLMNGKTYPVRIEVLNTANQVLQTVDVPALQTVSRATLANVLTWVASTSTQVGVRVRVPAKRVNGEWVAEPIATGDTLVVGTYEGRPYNHPNENPPLEPVYSLNLPSGMPGEAGLPPDSQSVWNNQGATDALDKGTYREGVDKLLTALDGDAVENPTTFPAEPEAEHATSMGTTAVDTLVGKLPAVPEITPVSTTVSSFSWNLSIPGLEGNYAFAVDLEQWESPINLGKTLMRGVLALWFFFLVLRAVKEAAA